MQTVTLDIIEEKAIKLLEDMEGQRLIRLHKNLSNDPAAAERVAKLKGTMLKQPMTEIDRQLKEFRDEWE